MSRTVRPYGSWPSPISAEALVEQAVRLSDVTVVGNRVLWVEGRPAEAGRQVLVAAEPGGGPTDLTPPGFSVRTQVHEYGGRCYAVDGDTIVFANWADQRLWALVGNGEPFPLTPEPVVPRGDRYADPVISPDGAWVIAVHEHHDDAGSVTNDVVAIPLASPEAAAPPRVLAAGHDFYSTPRLSPDGSRLAWTSWDHPAMPWDATELSVAGFAGGSLDSAPARVAGGPETSVVQPRWSPAGVLHYVSDESGWWNIYDETGAARCEQAADFAGPDWAFGNSSYAFVDDGIVAAWSADGGERLGRIVDGRAEPIDLPLTQFASLQPAGTGLVAIAGSPTMAAAVVRIEPTDASVTVIRRSRELSLDPTDVSVPEAVRFETVGGEHAFALFYPPANASVEGPPGERPPLIVISHGGPTGATSGVLRPEIQYWTSRGFAVADVDYRGSSGYGRAYRRSLNGRWGIADVEDCSAVVGWLDRQARVDGRRAVIRGGSAGGFTTLAALAFTDTFAAGASHYGVADLELLARETHKFESRYMDGLVGPYPAAADVYRQRSPIHAVDRINCPLILFQGLEDMIVPPDQAELMYEALRARGIPVAYLPFAGEQHGFRQAANIVTVARMELAFYGRVLGFEPAGEKVDLEIANAEAISPPG